MGARRIPRRGKSASDLAQCGYLHMKNSIPHHAPVVSDLENIGVADEVSCVDVFRVNSSRFGGYNSMTKPMSKKHSYKGAPRTHS